MNEKIHRVYVRGVHVDMSGLAKSLGKETFATRAALVAVVSLALVLTGMGAGAVPAWAESEVVPIVFPLQEKVEWTDTFGAPRSGDRTHEGNDLMVPKMTPLLAVVDGTLDWMNMDEEPSSYNAVPSYNILLRGDDGNDYFYIHLNNDTPGTDDGQGGTENAYAPGLDNGSRVEAGQVIGYAGDSGNAELAGSQLHFEIHLGGYKNPINPYDSLMAAPLAGNESDGQTKTEPEPEPESEPLFEDANPTHWFYEDLLLLYEKGVVKGRSDGTFGPYEDLTRAHFTALIVRTFAPEELEKETAEELPFTDVPETFWGYDEISTASRLGLVNGTGDGTMFAPNASVTRAQMAAILCRVLGLDGTEYASDGGAEDSEEPVFSDVLADYWAAGDIAAAEALNLVNGYSDGSFGPDETTKRAHAVAVVARALRLP